VLAIGAVHILVMNVTILWCVPWAERPLKTMHCADVIVKKRQPRRLYACCGRSFDCGGVRTKTMIRKEPPARRRLFIHGRWLGTAAILRRSFGSVAATFLVCRQLQLDAKRVVFRRRARSPAIETIIVLPRHNWTIASENTNYKHRLHCRLFIGCQVVKSCWCSE